MNQQADSLGAGQVVPDSAADQTLQLFIAAAEGPRGLKLAGSGAGEEEGATGTPEGQED